MRMNGWTAIKGSSGKGQRGSGGARWRDTVGVQRGGDAASSRFGQSFQPGRHVDTVAFDVVVLNDQVAWIDADRPGDVEVGGRAPTGRRIPLR